MSGDPMTAWTSEAPDKIGIFSQYKAGYVDPIVVPAARAITMKLVSRQKSA
jgi:hypothetical protein